MAARQTTSRQKARLDRKLQLVYSNTHPGRVGPTLIEKMEAKLDEAILKRTSLQQDFDHQCDIDGDSDAAGDAWDSLKQNEGAVQMALRMIAIMRSTTTKTELERARARIAAK